MELYASGEIFDRIFKRGHFIATADLTRTIVNVMEACHLQGVMHRVLKPENFLFLGCDNAKPTLIQWSALIQVLALCPGGPLAFKLTRIDPPQPDGTDALQEVGTRLHQFVESVNVKFSFRGYVSTSVADIKQWMLDARPKLEAVSIIELHHLLEDPIPRRPIAIDRVLASIWSLKPKILTVVEQEVDHNRPVFLE